MIHQCAKLLHPGVCLYTSVHIATTQTTTVVVCLFIAVMLMSRLIRTQSQKFNSMKLKLLISFKETYLFKKKNPVVEQILSL